MFRSVAFHHRPAASDSPRRTALGPRRAFVGAKRVDPTARTSSSSLLVPHVTPQLLSARRTSLLSTRTAR